MITKNQKLFLQKIIKFVKKFPEIFIVIFVLSLLIFGICLIMSSVPDWSLTTSFEEKEFENYEELRFAIKKLIANNLELPYIFIRTKKELDIDIWKLIIASGYKIYNKDKSISIYLYYFVEKK